MKTPCICINIRIVSKEKPRQSVTPRLVGAAVTWKIDKNGIVSRKDAEIMK